MKTLYQFPPVLTFCLSFLLLSASFSAHSQEHVAVSNTASSVEASAGIVLEVKQMFYKLEAIKSTISQETYLELQSKFEERFQTHFDAYPNQSIFINNDALYKWIDENSERASLYFTVIYDFYIQLERL